MATTICKYSEIYSVLNKLMRSSCSSSKATKPRTAFWARRTDASRSKPKVMHCVPQASITTLAMMVCSTVWTTLLTRMALCQWVSTFPRCPSIFPSCSPTSRRRVLCKLKFPFRVCCFHFPKIKRVI